MSCSVDAVGVRGGCVQSMFQTTQRRHYGWLPHLLYVSHNRKALNCSLIAGF